MSRSSPNLSFGMAAFHAGLAARAGGVPVQCRLELARIALLDECPARRAVVAEFLRDVVSDPVGAGVRLGDFVSDQFGALPQAPEYEWQKRRDLQ